MWLKFNISSGTSLQWLISVILRDFNGLKMLPISSCKVSILFWNVPLFSKAAELFSEAVLHIYISIQDLLVIDVQ